MMRRQGDPASAWDRAAFVPALVQLVHSIQSQVPGVSVILMAPPPVVPPTASANGFDATIIREQVPDSIAVAVRTLGGNAAGRCAPGRVLLLSMQHAWPGCQSHSADTADTAGCAKYVQNDGVHSTVAGANAMADVAFGLLEQTARHCWQHKESSLEL